LYGVLCDSGNVKEIQNRFWFFLENSLLPFGGSHCSSYNFCPFIEICLSRFLAARCVFQACASKLACFEPLKVKEAHICPSCISSSFEESMGIFISSNSDDFNP
jgi:hypothetical protein